MSYKLSVELPESYREKLRNMSGSKGKSIAETVKALIDSNVAVYIPNYDQLALKDKVIVKLKYRNYSEEKLHRINMMLLESEETRV